MMQDITTVAHTGKFVLGLVGVLCWHNNYLPSIYNAMKVQAFDLLLPFIVACETDCGKKRNLQPSMFTDVMLMF